MLRGEGWQFLQCGKFLERAESTARLLDGKSYAYRRVRTTVSREWWTCTNGAALLKSAGARMRRRKDAGPLTPTRSSPSCC